MSISASLLKKLDALVLRYRYLTDELSVPEIVQDQKRFRQLSKERAQLGAVVDCYESYRQTLTTQQELLDMLSNETDSGMRTLLEEEIQIIQAKMEDLTAHIRTLLLPKDPDDECDVFLEIRAGTGGHEAAIFVGDLFRMYQKFVEKKGWHLEIMNTHEAEHGGFKEMIMKISGKEVFSWLKFESGIHRVQRIPVTESQGRIHTSACSVAVLPVLDEITEVAINTQDLRIDTYRASGSGGQHVNTTDSAVRITHIPTGVVAECQDERSQHKNKARALSLLQAKLLAKEREQQHDQQAETRRELVGSGDRSERIRTYNFPQNRITDHRIGLTLYQLQSIMEGELTSLIKVLMQEHQADQLARDQ